MTSPLVIVIGNSVGLMEVGCGVEDFGAQAERRIINANTCTALRLAQCRRAANVRMARIFFKCHLHNSFIRVICDEESRGVNILFRFGNLKFETDRLGSGTIGVV